MNPSAVPECNVELQDYKEVRKLIAAVKNGNVTTFSIEMRKPLNNPFDDAQEWAGVHALVRCLVQHKVRKSTGMDDDFLSNLNDLPRQQDSVYVFDTETYDVQIDGVNWRVVSSFCNSFHNGFNNTELFTFVLKNLPPVIYFRYDSFLDGPLLAPT